MQLIKSLIPIFLILLAPNAIITSKSTNSSSSSPIPGYLAGYDYTFGGYNLSVYLVKSGAYDMTLHIKGSGDLKDKELDLAMGTRWIYVNEKFIRIQPLPLFPDIHLTHTQNENYKYLFNLPAIFTSNQVQNFTTAQIDNETVILYYTVTHIFSNKTKNEIKYTLQATRPFGVTTSNSIIPTKSNPASNNQDIVIPIILAVIFVSIFSFIAYEVIKNNKKKRLILEKRGRNDNKVARYSRYPKRKH